MFMRAGPFRREIRLPPYNQYNLQNRHVPNAEDFRKKSSESFAVRAPFPARRSGFQFSASF
jgi:hypothetical protein